MADSAYFYLRTSRSAPLSNAMTLGQAISQASRLTKDGDEDYIEVVAVNPPYSLTPGKVYVKYIYILGIPKYSGRAAEYFSQTRG